MIRDESGDYFNSESRTFEIFKLKATVHPNVEAAYELLSSIPDAELGSTPFAEISNAESGWHEAVNMRDLMARVREISESSNDEWDAKYLWVKLPNGQEVRLLAIDAGDYKLDEKESV